MTGQATPRPNPAAPCPDASPTPERRVQTRATHQAHRAHNTRRSRRPRPASIALIAQVALVALVALPACQVTTSDKDVVYVNYDELQGLILDDRGLTLLVDVRNWREYDAGHIPGAICIPLPEIRPRDPALAGARNIVVYASHFESPLSPAAAKKLIADGYSNVYDFRGGVEFWQESGGQLATNTPPPPIQESP